jgi:hypothetical protein
MLAMLPRFPDTTPPVVAPSNMTRASDELSACSRLLVTVVSGAF